VEKSFSSILGLDLCWPEPRIVQRPNFDPISVFLALSYAGQSQELRKNRVSKFLALSYGGQSCGRRSKYLFSEFLGPTKEIGQKKIEAWVAFNVSIRS